MLVQTKASLVVTAAERYRDAHQRRGEWLPTLDGSDPGAIYAQLKALPATATSDDIRALTGDDRWTQNVCDECGEDRDTIVLVAIEIHHPTDMTAICTGCLEQALRLAKA